MPKTDLRSLAEALLFETFGEEPQPGYVNYGKFDRPLPEDPMSAGDLPVDPSPVASVNTLLDLPPVEDDDYEPASSADLALAAYALTHDVPGEDVKGTYHALRELIKNRAGKVNEAAEDTMLRDLEDDEDDDDDLDDYELGAAVQFEPAEEGMTLDDLAVVLGYGAASGARQYIGRILDRLKYFLGTMSKSDTDMLKQHAAEEYAIALEKADLIDDSDLADLLANLDVVMTLDGFRYFFNNAFVYPAYKQLEKNAATRIEDMVAKLGLPDKLHSSVLLTVVNQAMGLSEQKPKAILSKLERALPDEEASEAYGEYMNMLPRIIAAAEISEGLAQLAMQMYADMPEGKRAKLLRKSLTDVEEMDIA